MVRRTCGGSVFRGRTANKMVNKEILWKNYSSSYGLRTTGSQPHMKNFSCTDAMGWCWTADQLREIQRGGEGQKLVFSMLFLSQFVSENNKIITTVSLNKLSVSNVSTSRISFFRCLAAKIIYFKCHVAIFFLQKTVWGLEVHLLFRKALYAEIQWRHM